MMILTSFFCDFHQRAAIFSGLKMGWKCLINPNFSTELPTEFTLLIQFFFLFVEWRTQLQPVEVSEEVSEDPSVEETKALQLKAAREAVAVEGAVEDVADEVN